VTTFGDNGESGTYSYDGSGNIAAIGSDKFLYDAEGRLVTAVIRGVTGTYTYDAFGNRRTATGETNCYGQTVCATPLTLDISTNRLVITTNGTTTNVGYDAAGNITSASGGVYAYDGTGMMTEATVGSDDRQFVYTADDERIAVRQGASWTWTVRGLDNKVLREFTSVEPNGNSVGLPTAGGQWKKDYIWRDGLLLASTDTTGTYHYHLDHLGTPRLITNASGVKIAEHAYYPFGAEINLTPHEGTEEAMKFTGHERDIVAGDGHTLDDMHARYYNASLGRFLSSDPALPKGMSVGSAQNWNRYAYALGNPLNDLDPTGATVIFANSASKKAYDDYLANLDPDSEDYKNAKQLEQSDLTYVVRLSRMDGQTEGEVTSDGSQVFLNLASGGPQEKFSMTARMAHEIQHGVEVDNGMLGFRKMEGAWHVTFTDVQDEVLAWNAQLRQAPAGDYYRGTLRDYSNAKDKADFLIHHGYPQYSGKKDEVNNAPHVPGYDPGSLFRGANWLYRIPR
jgi:RHS repeat-associated protein